MNKNSTNVSTDSACIVIEALQIQAFSGVTRWIALLEAIGIVILNSVLIFLLLRGKKRSRMSFFVLHLAIADMAVGLLYVLPECIMERFLNNWEKFTCLVLYGYCANLTIYASTFLIVVLTIDRLFVVVWPLSSSTIGKKYRYGLILGAWVLAIALALPYALHIEFICTTQGNVCMHRFLNVKLIVMAELMINVLIPVCIIIVCYTWIIWTIWRREMAGFGCPQKVKFSNGSTLTHVESTHIPHPSSAKNKTVKILFAVVLVYIISWTPINVAQVLNVFDILETGDAYLFLHVLAPINSLMNPIVFLCFNHQILKDEKRRNTGYTCTTNLHTECDRL